MSNITLRIGGREYTLACAPGEEDHVTALGRTIAQMLDRSGVPAGSSESRALLYTALMLADEVHEARAASANVAQTLEMVATELETLAARLEKSAPST